MEGRAGGVGRGVPSMSVMGTPGPFVPVWTAGEVNFRCSSPRSVAEFVPGFRTNCGSRLMLPIPA